MIVGYKEKPMQNKARITLYGLRKEDTLVYDNQVEAGNKLLANVGKISMYGAPRTKLLTRLTKEVSAKSTNFFVETGLDFV